ncbi:hypothetical protein HPP92_021042 [Vanilla planifolia]|uniref:Uncharacterized protein n=1 Tax=Vanilla planifolia TaxID=51239 RepID=A0A835UKC3_VANPL|nr:hypothetical protein HPP92_021042 [Vanilla planifolia]
MEWDLEMPPWDLPELEANAPAANLSSVAASSGSSSGQKPGGMDCSGGSQAWRFGRFWFGRQVERA